MTRAVDDRSPSSERKQPSFSLHVSAYDRVSSLVLALIVFVGFFVVIMFLMWLTQVLSFGQEAVAVSFLDEPSGRGDHAKGYERDMEEPGLEEVEELMEPQMEALLEAVTDVVTSQAASLDALHTDASATSRGSGMGDSRRAGPGGDGNAIPRWERWEVRFASQGLDAYAKQLDQFGIELAAMGGGRKSVDYASGFASSRPRKRSRPSEQEQRLYMTWTGGALRDYDRQLLRRAGIETQGRILLQFYPTDVENELARLERTKAGNRSVEEIKKTVFGVRRTGSKYVFYVIEQRYRVIPAS